MKGSNIGNGGAGVPAAGVRAAAVPGGAAVP
jgi:hypothetical protein